MQPVVNLYFIFYRKNKLLYLKGNMLTKIGYFIRISSIIYVYFRISGELLYQEHYIAYF